MNARYYVPSLGRFASADTIVPDPTNPQQFNRFSYVLNNPIRLTDPTGHCAQEDSDCWDYLENDFCQDVDCNGGGWQAWLTHGWWWTGEEALYYFHEAWTVTELKALTEQLQTAITALANAGINWTDTPMSYLKISLHSGSNSWHSNGDIRITRSHLMDTEGRTLHHEIGHAFGLQGAYEAATNGGCVVFLCPRYAAEGYYFREYGRSGSDPLFRAHETWADAFSVFIFTMANGETPTIDDTGWNVITVDMLRQDDVMLNIHVATQNILVSKYGYGR